MALGHADNNIRVCFIRAPLIYFRINSSTTQLIMTNFFCYACVSFYERVKLTPEFFAAVSLRGRILCFLIGVPVPWNDYVKALVDNINDSNWPSVRNA